MTDGIRVIFDHRIFIYQPHGGMSRYYAGMIAELPAFGIDPIIISPMFTTERLRELPRSMVWGRQIAAVPKLQRLAMIAGELSHGSLARLARAQIVHETFYSRNRRAPARCPIVTTVHDMIPELFPQFFVGDVTPITKKASLDRAAHISCDSESTRRDLLDRFPQFEDRVSVVYLAYDPIFATPVRRASPRKDPYVLYVGGRGGWKNFGALLDALGRSRLPKEGIDLVCIGGGPVTVEEQQLIGRHGLSGRVHQVAADDDTLVSWYQHALMLAYPSLYEGFGIPPLEAMASGCPVVAGHASSLPEVCGDAAEWAVPHDTDSLVAALETVAFSDARRADLQTLGKVQASRFSWQECARQTSEIYKRLA